MTQQTDKDKIDSLERELEIMHRLTDISTHLTSRLPLDQLLERIMDAAVTITNSEAASVLLWNNRTHELFFASSTSDTANDLIGKPVPMNSIAGTILQENRTIKVEDTKKDPRHYSKVDEDIDFETRSLLGVPMIYKDRRIGVLEAINKNNLPWTERDEHYLSVLAAQAAVAIEDAQMVAELKRANEELNQLDKLKNDFIAIASHELRTPLGVILGYASFLQEETSESAREHASKVMDSALRLRRIIEDMINLRYLKQSQSDLMMETIPLRQLFDEFQHETLAMLDVQHSHLKIEVPDEVLMVRVDRTRLSMAMTNLLNNAISFSPEGGDITMRARRRTDKEAEVCIIDHGIGLEADKLERVFEEFYQVEDHMTRHVGGLGIGLPITRAIIRAHGGRIWAESEGLGKGCTFIFTMPLV